VMPMERLDQQTEQDPAQPEQASGGNGDLRDQVTEALRQVNDPELGINIVDLGLVYEVKIEGDTVHVDYSLTTMGCPIGPMIEQQIQALVEPIEGIENVEAELVLSPPWTPERMTEEAKAALGMF
jgi:metal-sulfur cluster biosynthetic enzyme